jgi:hypothetical protein
VLEGIDQKPLPDWLTSASTDRPVPWRELLDGSLYYPSCGTDGHPVQYLGGHCHSFVYADYGYSFEDISCLLIQPGAFSGYRLQSARLLDRSEIDLADAWKTLQIDPRIDGEPNRYRDKQVSSYAYWCIFERLPTHHIEHGPMRFSLLYLGMDGVAAFQALYTLKGTVPSVVGIIQPGEGFGGNWTHFFDRKQIFCRTVVGNPAGQPRYLLLGGYQVKLDFQRHVVWPGFESMVRFWKTSNGYLGLWESTNSTMLIR